MSDMKKIIEARNPGRNAVNNPEKRQLKALEDIADALEGIRQDLTTLPTALATSLQRVLQK
jgi:septum formation inhibitor-activating ATPase MinD